MGSRKEEERNEKIIRGLMKLPPNRRCINCNSLGPQYVCTNFWTFICMTCSGIHREFTHRVKSVSMAKFTSQEVESLQNGGNQRAREIYLNDWDPQRQRLPDSSNADKVREFIKNVYVEKKYAGGKSSDKPPRSIQSHKSFEGDTRRASSYHSYSQSPPYDYQYEERRYGKQAAALTRTPGSDRGYYVGKISSFVYSPGRSSDQLFEDRFANEGSVARVSDYSMSSGGDPFRSGTESPNFRKDIGFNSPTIQAARDISSENAQHQMTNFFSEATLKRDSDGIPHPQRTISLGSTGSLDNSSLSVKSYSTGALVDVSQPEQTGGSHQDKISTFAQSVAPVNYGGLDLFNPPVLPKAESTGASSIDLFQFPATLSAQSAVMIQPSAILPAASVNSYQPSQIDHSSSVDLFAESAEQQPVAEPPTTLHKNEGWATFDTPQAAAALGTENITPAIMPADGDSSVKHDQVSSLNTNMQWPSFQSSISDKHTSSTSSPWHEELPHFQAPSIAASTQSWNAFDDSIKSFSFEGVKQTVVAFDPSTADQHFDLRVFENARNDGMQRAAYHGGNSGSGASSNIVLAQSHAPSEGESQAHTKDRKSINPFDLPYDPAVEDSNMFLDMSSLQAALPNAPLPSTFLGSSSEPWLPQNAVNSYIPAVPQGGLAYMAGQVPNSQLQNVSGQGPVASIGGNPFA